MRSIFTPLLASIVMVGCSRGPTPTGARPESSTPASASPPASAPASVASSTAAAAVPAPDGPPLPLPAPPPGADPDAVAFAASICAAAYRGDATTKKKDVGCRSHPPFLRPEQLPDGKIIEHAGDPLLFCAIGQIFRGSFTRAGAKQAVLGFDQCKESENAMWDMGFPGSAVLVEEIGGRWKAVGYEPDVNTGFCLQNRRADGRDVLLCRSNLAAPPAGDVNYVYLIDFARGGAGKKSAGSLAKLFGDVPTCNLLDETLPYGYVSLQVSRMSLADLNKDGTGDLVLEVKRARVPPSPALAAKVLASCTKDRSGGGASAFLPAPKLTTLQFLSDGEVFTPSAATKKELDAWTAEAPSGFNGLSEVGPAALTK